jgi:hypothetical protein
MSMTARASGDAEMEDRDIPEFFEWRPVDGSPPQFACVPGTEGIPEHPRPTPASSVPPMYSFARVGGRRNGHGSIYSAHHRISGLAVVGKRDTRSGTFVAVGPSSPYTSLLRLPSSFKLLLDGNNSTVRQAADAVPLYRRFRPTSPSERSTAFRGIDDFSPDDNEQRIRGRLSTMRL